MSQQQPTGDEQLTNEDSPNEKVDVGSMHAAIMREQNEPRDGFEPIPIWLVGIFGALLFWGGWYLSTYSGGWRSDILDEHPSARMVIVGGAPKPIDPLVLGENLYIANCTACHGVTGQGSPGVFPPLAGSEWVIENPARLKRIVLHGVQGPITVKGETYNNAMPGLGGVLDDDKISAILTYVRHAWDNGASAISPAEVAATREATQSQRAPYNAEDLLAIVEDDIPEGASGEAAPTDSPVAPATPQHPAPSTRPADVAPPGVGAQGP